MGPFSQSFFVILIILGAIAFFAILCCLIHIILDWKKIKFAKPWNGPSKPPPSRRAIRTRQKITQTSPIERTDTLKVPTPKPPKTRSNATGKGVDKSSLKPKAAVKGTQKSEAAKARPAIRGNVKIPDVVVEDLS